MKTSTEEEFACGHPRSARNTAPVSGRPRGRCRTCYDRYQRDYKRRQAAELRALRADGGDR